MQWGAFLTEIQSFSARAQSSTGLLSERTTSNYTMSHNVTYATYNEEKCFIKGKK